MRPPAVIFDFGNVLAFFDYERAASRLGAQFGLSGPEFLDRLRRAGMFELARRYESGQIETPAFLDEACALSGLPITPVQFAEGWVDIFWANASVAPLVRALRRADHRLILGSNTNALHADHFRRQFADVLADFDHLVMSHEVGAMKPDARFFRACVDAANREPADCLFIDDLAENVEGARAAGLTGIHYRDTPTLIDDLLRSGVQLRRDDLAFLADSGHVD
ncbi:MAG: HAD family phosphatase [Thermoleophilia bacterium]|nr:HAD family phosphatase [Thermoleophilia bacterium]